MSSDNPPEQDREDMPPEGAEAEAPEGVDLEAELERLRAEAASLKDQLLRALAEAENTRRRVQRDREDFARYATAPLAKDILPVADNLARALAAVPEEALAADEALKNLVDGIAATERQLLSALERHNIKRIEPEGEKFDSHRHQAMFEVPGSGEPAGTVVQVLQPGYLLHDRLLRPALVGIAKGESRAGASSAAETAGD